MGAWGEGICKLGVGETVRADQGLVWWLRKEELAKEGTGRRL